MKVVELVISVLVVVTGRKHAKVFFLVDNRWLVLEVRPADVMDALA
jgi:hypothetical protein